MFGLRKGSIREHLWPPGNLRIGADLPVVDTKELGSQGCL